MPRPLCFKVVAYNSGTHALGLWFHDESQYVYNLQSGDEVALWIDDNGERGTFFNLAIRRPKPIAGLYFKQTFRDADYNVVIQDNR